VALLRFAAADAGAHDVRLTGGVGHVA
jgi:hypothetical protein